jgi:hypothetical protein
VALPLLDDERLDGTFGIERLLSPRRLALVVNDSDMADATSAVEELCLVWGGSVGALIPHTHGDDELSARWAGYVHEAVIDDLAVRGLLPEQATDEAFKSSGTHAYSFVGGDPLLSVIYGLDRKPEDWAPVDCSLPASEDPWYLAYLGCFGAWPERPSEGYLRRTEFVPDFEFERLVPVERGGIESPGPADLVERLRRQGQDYPARIACDGLGLARAPEASHVSANPVLPSQDRKGAEYGSNLVVVYEPGNVADLCLLWNLRAAHGLFPGVPLAVPVGEAVEALSTWSRHPGDGFALRLFGLVVGRPWGLVSTSVDQAQLQSIANAAGGNWASADIDTVLHPGDRASRPSTDVAVFHRGRARVPGFSPADREMLARRPRAFGRLDLRVRLRPEGELLPPSRLLRRWLPLMHGYQGGGMECGSTKPDGLISLDWPAGWNVLEAVMRDRGFAVRPSRPGRAAVALLRRLGSLGEVEPLLSPVVLKELDRLGERSGRTFFEGRIRQLQADLAALGGGAGERSEAIERKLDELRLCPFETDQHELTFDQLKDIIGAPGAKEWLDWAEDRGLVVRGVHVRCDRCGATSWRAAGELAPPVICPGCGQPIPRPFRPDVLSFRYRASEMLLQVLSQSALPHVLALRWLCALLSSHGLYGAHPGVEVLDGDDVIGELDVVLLFSGGELAIGECKLTPRGLVQDEVDRFEALTDRIGADWTFYSVPAWAADCTPIWPSLQRELPSRPRWALTHEQLLTPGHDVFWSARANPFAWSVADDASRDAHHQTFIESLPKGLRFLQEPVHLDRMIFEE